jgi:predicted ATPase
MAELNKTMRIESIELQNYRCFKDTAMENISQLSVLVGKNGSGKSTLFDVFTFLKDALVTNVAKAVSKRGGYKELVSRGSTGPIKIILKFRETGGRLATYELEIAEKNGQTVVSREILKFRRGQRGQPWHFVDFSEGAGSAITNESAYGEEEVEEERKEYYLDDPSVLAIKGLGQFKEFRVVSEFRTLIENWHISDFHIAEARTSPEDSYSEHLSMRGDNVAQVAQFLHDYHPQRFQEVLNAMKRCVPGLEHVEARTTEDGRLVLKFKDGSFKDPFVSRYVSDGTIKMFAYLVLLYDPSPFPLLAIEEPENQLYPQLMYTLAEEFRAYAQRGGQVFVSTHSPQFLNGFNLDEIYVLEKQDGYTTIKKVTEMPLLEKLIAEGDLPGALWMQGFFNGDVVK